MNADVARKLFDLNKEFYQNFAASFAQTRNRIQPGVRKILDTLPIEGNWLDIGCGIGSLAVEWVKQGRTGVYYGLDASPKLIQIAKEKVTAIGQPNQTVVFQTLTTNSEEWISQIPEVGWDGVLLFAVMHHIPGFENRVRLCRQVRSLLKPEGLFILSCWQLQNSNRLKERIWPWRLVEIDEADVDAGDVLLDWRAKHPDDSPVSALRYVHLFTEMELNDLARQSGFRVTRSFFSDGKEGNLGLYQIWQIEY